MKENHVIDILEGAPLAGLTDNQLATVRLHIEGCPACRNAFEAAEFSTMLIRTRASEVITPSPFFHTKVLATLRERQANENVPVIWRLWKTAGALVSSMALTTAALAVFSLVVPGPSTYKDETATLNSYSAEGIILGQDQGDEQMTYDQVLSTIYADEFEGKQQ
jgi:predicted anti-sigma-YlaC factor YlaD